MAKDILRIPLKATSPGTSRALVVHRYGTAGARPKAYLQASLHADELPGMLALHHLIRLLNDVDHAGGISGEIVLVPVANPIGLDQDIAGSLIGRYELGGGGNFNRGWPNFTDTVARRVSESLDDDVAANVARIRSEFLHCVDELDPANAFQSQQAALMHLAIDADIVLDLHCDSVALVHLYLSTASWPDGQDLSADIGSRATLLAIDSGGNSFDEAFSAPWHILRERFGSTNPIPQACLSGTIELRGQSDVSDTLAEADAQALLRFLRRRGLVTGDPGPLPEPLCDAVPLEAVDVVRAPDAGILTYPNPLGKELKAGELVAELVDPFADDPRSARTPIATQTDGLLLSIRRDNFVRPGQTVAKVVGREPLPDRTGNLLED